MLYSGKNIIDNKDRQPAGGFVSIDGERFYEIRDRMAAFFADEFTSLKDSPSQND